MSKFGKLAMRAAEGARAGADRAMLPAANLIAVRAQISITTGSTNAKGQHVRSLPGQPTASSRCGSDLCTRSSSRTLDTRSPLSSARPRWPSGLSCGPPSPGKARRLSILSNVARRQAFVGLCPGSREHKLWP
jgi:hypothetical protein